MGAVLSIATILGGIAAVWYIWDKYKDKSKWDEREKVVNSNWWESSELKHALENQGYKFRWSDRSRIKNGKRMDMR